ncbi:ammonium transporter [Citrobacter koseri]|uniref:Ammonium transporter n=1 Tax=Citrobacter koseri TaxID=545 RepID=A0A2X2UYQ3_CITKO|nr:ammonium transporter [Citrobacter koseri]
MCLASTAFLRHRWVYPDRDLCVHHPRRCRVCRRRDDGASAAGAAGEYRYHHRLVWRSGVYRATKLADITVGLRVPEEQEREGLDVNSHGENAYNALIINRPEATLLRRHSAIFNCDCASRLPERSMRPSRHLACKTPHEQNHGRWKPRCSLRCTATIRSC